MIRSACIDHKRAVGLFEKDDAHELVRKGHFRERELEVSATFDLVGKSVRAAYNKADTARAALVRVYFFGELLGRELFTLDAKRYTYTVFRYLRRNERAFLRQSGAYLRRGRRIG